MKKVFVETCGGLGNQLFQIVAALTYAKRTGRKCFFRKDLRSGSALGTRDTYWSTLFKDLEGVNEFPPDLKEHPDNHQMIPNYNEENVLLKGYYQNLVHLDSKVIQSIIPNEFLMKAEKLLIDHDQAFLHVRRGDYLKLQYFHPILPVSYYEKAIQHFDSETKFLVFCEEADKKSIEKEFEASLILKDRISFSVTSIPDYLQMLMMSLCSKGGIMANSSFSGFASLLSPYRKIVYPETWFVGQEKPPIMYANWIKV
jgi:hypothetical protein